MEYTKVEVDILCEWEFPEVYRLYLDGELMTERTYIWVNPAEYVKEHMLVEVSKGEHVLELVPVNPEFKKFTLANLTVNKKLAKLENNKFTV